MTDNIKYNNKRINKESIVIKKLNDTKIYKNIVKKEALRYSNLDDFLKTQKKYYHWTFSNFDKFSLKEVWKNTEYDNAQFWIFFSDNKEAVKKFLNITKEAWSRNEWTIKEARLVLNNPLMLTLIWIFNNEKQAPLLINILGWEKQKDDIEALEYINDNVWIWEISEFIEGIYQNKSTKKLMQSHWYDWIISDFWKEDDWKYIYEYVAFDTSQIFSEDDLVSIYNDVHNKN